MSPVKTSRKSVTLGVALSAALVFALVAIPVLAAPKGVSPPSSSPKCLVQTNPSTLNKHSSLQITVQVVNGDANSTYSGTAYVFKQAILQGSAVYTVNTDVNGSGKTTQTYPTNFGAPSVTSGLYNVTATVADLYTSLSCSATFSVK